MSWLSNVFERNPAGLNWPRAVMVLDVALVPLVVFWAIGHEVYLLSALFGLLFALLADPGGSYGRGSAHVAAFALTGAALTALAFGIGGDPWGWLVLAAFVVTLVAGLAVMFGVRMFVEATLLNLWFIRRGLPGALDVVRRGDRCHRHAPRRPARQARHQNTATTSHTTSMNAFSIQRGLAAAAASQRRYRQMFRLAPRGLWA